jgi:hypothetical protein
MRENRTYGSEGRGRKPPYPIGDYGEVFRVSEQSQDAHEMIQPPMGGVAGVFDACRPWEAGLPRRVYPPER